MRIVRLSIVLLVCIFSTFTLAASQKRTIAPPKNKVSGWYLGLGYGANVLVINRSKIRLSGNDTQLDSYYPTSYKSTANPLSPVVQFGYWGNFARLPRRFWGLKAVYKYFGTSANDVPSAGNDIFNSNYTQVIDEAALVFSMGLCLKNISPYLGVGVMWLPSVRDTWYEDPVDLSKKKSMLGVAVQLGFLYNLNSKWFIDTVYSFGMTGKTSFDNIGPDSNDINIFNRKISVFAQEVMIGINRRFSS